MSALKFSASSGSLLRFSRQLLHRTKATAAPNTTTVSNATVAQQPLTVAAPRRTTRQLLAYSVGIGGTAGVAYAGYEALQQLQPAAHQTRTEEAFFVNQRPDVPITRRYVAASGVDATQLDLVLFQYQTCPFCCKVRAFLDSQGLPYSVVEVDAVLRQSIKWSPYKKVPMLLARCKDGRYIQLTESSRIISILASVLTDPTQDVAELYKFYPTEQFVDDNGKPTSDVVNKYFLMLQDQRIRELKGKEIE